MKCMCIVHTYVHCTMHYATLCNKREDYEQQRRLYNSSSFPIVTIKYTKLHVRQEIVQFNLDTGLEFLNNPWGLGTEQEQVSRTGPPDNTAWQNWFLGIDSWAP